MRRSLGLGYVGDIFDTAELKLDNDPGDAVAAFPVHEPSGMLAVTDLLRRCMVHLRSDAAADTDVLRRDRRQVTSEVAAAIRGLGAQHMVMCREMTARSKSFFAAEFLIQCLIFSGWLKSQHDMESALTISIGIKVPFKKHQEYLLQLMRSTHKTPSRTTMYKHRLMLVGGCAAYQAAAAAKICEQDDIVRFCTMDGSPQHGYDWLLHGSITVSVTECVELYHLATEYITRSLEQGPDDAENRTCELRARLSKALCKVLSMPVAVGSGKAGIRHKLHSLVHAERMYSWSWGATAAMVSRSFCWTGDLGCESSVTRCRVALRKLFPWATDKAKPPPPPKYIRWLGTLCLYPMA